MKIKDIKMQSIFDKQMLTFIIISRLFFYVKEREKVKEKKNSYTYIDLYTDLPNVWTQQYIMVMVGGITIP